MIGLTKKTKALLIFFSLTTFSLCDQNTTTSQITINPFEVGYTTQDPIGAVVGTALIGIFNYDLIKKDIEKTHEQKIKGIDFDFLKEVEQSISKQGEK